MAANSQDHFFDVLIDRIITDVKRDFEASLREQESDRLTEDVASARDSIFDEPSKKRAPQMDDLVSKMIGFRSRLDSQTTKSVYSLSAPRKFDQAEIRIGAASASRIKATPRFSSSESEVAFALVLKSGAQFYTEDMIEGEISREALKRERRRVLLTLHPDRVPETDRVRAHDTFLSAAEAFSILAESASTSRAA